MKCEICGRGMESMVNLHRQNKLGEIGIWRCDDCNKLPISSEVKNIIDALNPRKS